MASCERIRPLLSHVVEGEATPEEAMHVARHLADCTACKIVLAREHRLAEMLEQDLEDLPVGEEFVEAVMANLPKDPPPRRRNAARWRGLKMAGFAGFIGSGALLAFQDISLRGVGGPTVATRSLDFESAQGSFEAALGLVRLALVAAQSAVSLPLDATPWSVALGMAGVVTAVGLIGFCLASTTFAFAATSLVRVGRSRAA
jgi:predicted anti-sigma-YlaC factor YlaD